MYVPTRLRSGYPTLIYDSGCRICAFFARLMAWADFRRRLDFVPYQEKAARDLLGSLTQAEIESSAHLVEVDGDILSGPKALHRALGLLPVIGPAYGRLSERRIGVRLEETLYSLGVAIRNRLECLSSA